MNSDSEEETNWMSPRRPANISIHQIVDPIFSRYHVSAEETNSNADLSICSLDDDPNTSSTSTESSSTCVSTAESTSPSPSPAKRIKVTTTSNDDKVTVTQLDFGDDDDDFENYDDARKSALYRKTLTNCLVLKALFRELPSDDLKQARLVCHLWRSFATEQMQRKHEFFFSYLETPKSAQFDSVFRQRFGKYRYIEKGPRISQGKLNTFRNDLQSSSHFPCHSFNFHTFLFESKRRSETTPPPNLQYYLTSRGQTIKNLALQLSYVEQRDNAELMFLKDMRTLLIHQAPNLETLYLEVFLAPAWFSLSNINAFTDGVDNRSSLPVKNLHTIPQIPPDFRHLNLKKVKISVDVSPVFFQDIVTHAPNLQELEISPKSIALLMDSNRIHLLKSLTLLQVNPPLPSLLEKYDILSKDQNLRLREVLIKFEDQWPSQVWNVLRKCSNTLEKVKWIIVAGKQKWEDSVGSFPAVTCIQIACTHSKKPEHFFPLGLNIPHVFPNLDLITMEEEYRSSKYLESIPSSFDSFVKSPNVKHVLVRTDNPQTVGLPNLTSLPAFSPGRYSPRLNYALYSKQLTAMFPNASVIQKELF